MACRDRLSMIAYVIVLVIASSAVDANDFFSQFHGMFDDPFMLMFQNRSTCGHRGVASPMPDGDDMEREVFAGEHPWQAALYHGEMKLCSAVLIHEQWLLTAASCIPYLKEPYMVIAGTLSLLPSSDDDDRNQHTQRRMTTEIFVHPNYDARRMESDIALVKVELPFELNDHVNVICLPHPKMHRDFRPGTKARLAGWGHLPPATERPGMCPKPAADILNECEAAMCETDAECSIGEKCCQNGCAIMTCIEAMTSGSGPRPGVLWGGVTPLINHTACNQTMMGVLPKGVICAGATPRKQVAGGMEMMEEGGIMALLKWKREMREMARDNGDNRDDDGGGLFRDVNLMQTMSLLMERIDGFDGSVDTYRRRQSGAWSISNTGGVMRSGDDDNEMEDAWMRDEMADEMDDVEGMRMDKGMEGEMERRMEEEDGMEDDMMTRKEKMMMTMMKKNCKGDKGSPLVAELEGQWFVLGVTTLPRGCLFGSSPGLFTHAFNIQEWIRPIFNGKPPKRKSTQCTVGEFSCSDGWCIPEKHRCDGTKDCMLGTDEGPFCQGAMKGFNVYLDHHLNRSTVARAFPVKSFAQCAQACLTEPYLCPGFDVVIMPVQADSPPIVPKYPTDDDHDDDDDDEEKEVTYDVEDEKGDEIFMMMNGKMIMCLLTNSTSSVGSKDDVVPISRLDMVMKVTIPLAKSIHLHFKLPRHAPLAAVFSPTMNLYLPTGLIVSPSYILGHDLATRLEDKSFVLRFMKKLRMEELIKVSHISCFMSHQDWDVVQEMMETVKMMREEARNGWMMMMMEGEGGDDEMGGYKMRVEVMKMHLKEMAMNFTMVMTGIRQDCEVMSIKRRLLQRIRGMMGNASCEMMSMARDIEGEETRDSVGEEGEQTGVMMVLMKMMDELEELMPDLLMMNMYPEEDGDGMMKPSTEMIMRRRGSMMGDALGMLGNDDVMSSFLTGQIEMKMMESEVNAQSLNSSKMVLMREIMAISSDLISERCNLGNMTADDGPQDKPMDAGMDLEEHTETEAKAFDMMRMKKLRRRVKVGHQKWSIAQSPRQVNNVNFRILDARRPMGGGNNIIQEFGMVLARGLGGAPMETNMIVSHMIRRMMMMMDQKRTVGDSDMGGKGIDEMAGEMLSSVTGEERDALDWDQSTMDDEAMAAMVGVLLGDMDEEVFWNIIESVAETIISSGKDVGPVMRLVEALHNDDIDAETFVREIGPELVHRIYARVMMKLKMADARGRAYPMGDLHPGKSFTVDGSLVDISHYATNQSQQGILMEYKSGWRCDQKITKMIGVLTSPNFPRAYPSNTRCNSFITAPPGYVVILSVLRFKLQWSPYCLRDSLTVYDETTPHNWTKLGQGSFCGTTVPHVFRSSGPNLLVKFVSEPYHGTSKEGGFKMIYTFQPVARAMIEQEGRSSSDSTPELTGANAQTKLHHMREKLMGLKISLGVVSGVLLLVCIISLVWVNYQAKTRREKSKEVFDTKL